MDFVNVHGIVLFFKERNNCCMTREWNSSEVVDKNAVYLSKQVAWQIGDRVPQGMLKLIQCEGRDVQWRSE